LKTPIKIGEKLSKRRADFAFTALRVIWPNLWKTRGRFLSKPAKVSAITHLSFLPVKVKGPDFPIGISVASAEAG